MKKILISLFVVILISFSIGTFEIFACDIIEGNSEEKYLSEEINIADIKLDLSNNNREVSYYEQLVEIDTEEEDRITKSVSLVEKLGFYLIKSLSFIDNKTKENVELIFIKGDWQKALREIAEKGTKI